MNWYSGGTSLYRRNISLKYTVVLNKDIKATT